VSIAHDRLAVMLAGDGIATDQQARQAVLAALRVAVAERRKAQAAGVPWIDWVQPEALLSLEHRVAAVAAARPGGMPTIIGDEGRELVTQWCWLEAAEKAPV